MASASAKDKDELSLHQQGTQCPPPGRALRVLEPKARSGVWPPGKQAIYDPGSAPALMPWTAPLLALPWKSWVIFNSSLWLCARHRKMLETLLVCRTAHSRGAEGHADISSPSPLPWVVARSPPVWKQQRVRGLRATLGGLGGEAVRQFALYSAPSSSSSHQHGKVTAPGSKEALQGH